MWSSVWPVARGGTGATTSTDAATNLAVVSNARIGAANGVPALDANSKLASTNLYGFRAAAAGGRVFGPMNPYAGAGKLLIADTAYFVYVGQMAEDVTPQFIRFSVNPAGGGAQTAELGLFSTPLPPCCAGQELTKIEATGSVDDLATTGQKENTGAFSTLVPAGTHLWAGLRTNMAGAEPTVNSVGPDTNCFTVMMTTTAGALTASSTFTGGSVGGTTAPCPALYVTLD